MPHPSPRSPGRPPRRSDPTSRHAIRYWTSRRHASRRHASRHWTSCRRGAATVPAAADPPPCQPPPPDHPPPPPPRMPAATRRHRRRGLAPSPQPATRPIPTNTTASANFFIVIPSLPIVQFDPSSSASSGPSRKTRVRSDVQRSIPARTRRCASMTAVAHRRGAMVLNAPAQSLVDGERAAVAGGTMSAWATALGAAGRDGAEQLAQSQRGSRHRPATRCCCACHSGSAAVSSVAAPQHKALRSSAAARSDRPRRARPAPASGPGAILRDRIEFLRTREPSRSPFPTRARAGT